MVNTNAPETSPDATVTITLPVGSIPPSIGPAKRIGIITGGTTGIGLACARHLLAKGWQVIVSNLPSLAESGQAVATSLGPSASFIACDVTSASDVQTLINTVHSTYGSIHGLVLNAGICIPTPSHGPLHLDSAANFQRHWDVNVMGILYCIQAAAPLMAKQPGGGAIVNMCSIAGMRGTKGVAAYNTSKWAVQGLTKSAAVDYADSGVRVNAVAPGFIDTEMVNAVLPCLGGREGVDAFVPLGCMGKPEDVAKVVEFLLNAEYVTGITLPVDGGVMS